LPSARLNASVSSASSTSLSVGSCSGNQAVSALGGSSDGSVAASCDLSVMASLKALEREDGPLVTGDGVEDQRFQFAHVARETIGVEQLVEGQRLPRRRLAKHARRLVHEVMDQEGQVAYADAQRWEMEMVSPQPVI
jgi:hypothetical protein